MTKKPWQQGGFTLVELALGLVIIAIALMGLVSLIYGTTQINWMNQDIQTASRASQKMVEKLMSEDFSQVFALYNDNPMDDPMGQGTAPGQWFAVTGLKPAPGNQNVGRIIFPTQGTGPTLQLREDVVDAETGMPRDLNKDGVVDGLPHNTDYQILPVKIRIEWQAPNNRTMTHEVAAILTKRK